MVVYDRWHKTERREVDGEVVRVKVPSADYGCARRWQVRWRDESGAQRKKNFARKAAAEDFDAQNTTDLARGDYVDPRAGKVRLKVYGRQWLAEQPFDNASTREATELRLRLHVFDDPIGDKELRALKPSTIRAWVTRKKAELSPRYVRTIYANLSALLAAAVDDGKLAKSPMAAASVKPPTAERPKVVPWTLERVTAVRSELPDRYAAMVDAGAGLGLRQGEVFGLAVDDVDFLGRVVHVRRQVKIVGARLVFAPPKRDKERDVPLPESVALRLAAHVEQFPPVAVTLPWKAPDGKPVTARLIFTSREGKAMNRNYFNAHVWKPALHRASVEPTRENGFHALRHHLASILLAGGVDIRTLAEVLGHTDPGFTLRTYTHLMPDAGERMRKAVDLALSGRSADGPPLAVVP